MCDCLRLDQELFYLAAFESGHLGPFPWGDRRFDIFVAVLDPIVRIEQMRPVLERLVALNNDWIETLGPEAEALHDEIDQASVAVGRQNAIGDGSPMTAWHEESMGHDEMIEYISGGGHGGSEYKLVLLVGSQDSCTRFAGRMRQRMLAQKEGAQ
jgi:hypothetical protein